MKKYKNKASEQVRKRRYYFFDYLFWLGEMAQYHYKGEPRRPDGESFLMFCFITLVYGPVFCTTGYFYFGSSAFEWFTIAMIVGLLVILHCIHRGWIYPLSRKEAVLQHYEGHKFSPPSVLLFPVLIRFSTYFRDVFNSYCAEMDNRNS